MKGGSALLWLFLDQADPIFLRPVTHQTAQRADRQDRDFMHANEQRCADWRAAMPPGAAINGK